MCTATWTHGADASSEGYHLFFNRDELRTRGPEVPPSVLELGGVRYVAPADSDAGGTWIATNEFGLTVGLLNGYIESRGPAPDAWTSRGELVRSLADLRGVDQAWNRLTPAALAAFRPCVVLVVAPRGPSLLARWDGRDLVLDARAERQLPITSSSFEQSGVQSARRETYRVMVADAAGDEPPSVELLRAYQNHVTPGGPTAYTPTMARPDAATRSQCFVDVDAHEIRFHYAPGPPHETPTQAPIVLERAPSR